MSDIRVFMIVNLTVTDANEYRSHEKGFSGFLKKYGGEFVTFDGKRITFEGDAPRA